MGYQSVRQETTHVVPPHEKNAWFTMKAVIITITLLTTGIIVGMLGMHIIESAVNATNGSDMGYSTAVTFVTFPKALEGKVGDELSDIGGECAFTSECDGGFCNFDNGDTGFCESCDDIGEDGCEGEGYDDNGAASCIAYCETGANMCGECSTDADCVGDLECFERYWDEDTAMLGCPGTYDVAQDICVTPEINTKEAVCYNDQCKSTSYNSIPDGETWINEGRFSSTGCCLDEFPPMMSPCDLCVPPTRVEADTCALLTPENMAEHCTEICGNVVGTVEGEDCKAKYSCVAGDGECSACGLMIALAILFSVISL